MAFKLPVLPYAFDALEPHIDARTMEIHYSRHHRAYADNFNAAIEKHPGLFEKSAEEIIADLDMVPEDIRMAVRNHGGGYLNHNFFWQVIGPDGGEPSGDLKKALSEAFGSFGEFKQQFEKAGLSRFGSGWVWLIAEGKLEIVTTANQDNPITEGKTPILTADVWEHAYYLKYQNKRADYLKAFWNVVNWKEVEKRFTESK
ncbi:superoxide dismutase [Candidatus Peribacteria bacterium RIFCSPLOWO2_01_FULL_51_18]|nr:MAG: superoxide dismutase [Candidatus Peribacteria bacterium RIFCSPHIGHO2_02_FULL_51_15]OGJ65588.1 MAG: superoxide dismutase [Candidatus Peribacteria bacterium RIFCSPLOWO2_01_FULL_51_18]